MRKRFLAAFGCAVFIGGLCPHPSSASCDTVLTIAGKNVSIARGNEAVIANKYASACFLDISYADDSTIANVDIEIFGEGSGSGSLSTSRKRDRLTNWCTLNKNSYSKNQSAYQETQSVYRASVTAWLACKNIESKTLELNPQVADDMLSITFLVRWATGGHGGPFQGIYARGFNCKATISEHGTLEDVTPNRPIEIDGNGLPISCVRNPPRRARVNNQAVRKYPSGSITVNASGTSFKMDFAELNVPEITEVTKRNLQNQIDSMKADMNALQAQVAAINISVVALDAVNKGFAGTYVRKDDNSYVKYQTPLAISFNNEPNRCLNSAFSQAWVRNDLAVDCVSPKNNFLWLLVRP